MAGRQQNTQVLCSEHFEEKCFDRTGQTTRLWESSIPTIFKAFPKYMIKVTKERKPPKDRSGQITACSRSNGETSSEQELEVLSGETAENGQAVQICTHMAAENAPAYTSSDVSDENLGHSTINQLKRKLKSVQEQLGKARKKIKLLQQQNRRGQHKILTLKQHLENMMEKKMISNDAFEILKAQVPDSIQSLLDRLAKENKLCEYPAELRKFAVTLHYYSPTAYEYLRSHFNNCLPAVRTIRHWYSSVNGEPGFTSEAFKLLEAKAATYNQKQKELQGALIIDEMAIREFVEYDGNKIHGYVDCGLNIDDDTLPLAKHAFVFMLVGVKERFKLPVGYFLIHSLTGIERAELVRQCCMKLNDVNVRVVSITLDGCGSNLSMLRSLGANLEIDNLHSWFPHPSDNSKFVHIIFDPCHMLKLMRNMLADRKFLYDDNGHVISWKYIEQLHSLQQNEGLHLGNKLRTAHMSWQRNKMKVKLAAQTISASVADAIEYCEETLKLPQFKDCSATVRFLRTVDHMFDVMNSSNLFAKGYKAPMQPKNAELWKNFFTQTKLYLMKLRSGDDKLLCKSNRRMPLLGFIVCIQSFISLYIDLVESGCQEYLLAYRFSQDNLETFFGCIRRLGGWNNNPTCRQFRAAYKKLLVQNEIKMANTGNCIPLCEIPLITASIQHSVTNSQSSREYTDIDAILCHDHPYSLSWINMPATEFTSCVIPYIGGFVAKKIAQKIDCSTCIDALVSSTEFYSLLDHKSNGGLVCPSPDVVSLCNLTEKHFRYSFSENNLQKVGKLSLKIVHDVLQHSFETGVFESLLEHDKRTELLSSHSYLLAKQVCHFYLKLRLHYACKQKAMDVAYSKSSSRRTLTRLVINNSL